MEIKASLLHLRMAPRKVRAVADMLRGRSPAAASQELMAQPRRAAIPLLKLLRSALANASHNFKLAASDVYIQDIRVDGGAILKRMRPRAMGRSAMIRKRTSHVTLVLSTFEDVSVEDMRGIPEDFDTKIIEEGASGEVQAQQSPREFDQKSYGNARSRFKTAPLRKSQGLMKRMFRRKVI